MTSKIGAYVFITIDVGEKNITIPDPQPCRTKEQMKLEKVLMYHSDILQRDL